MRRRRHGLGDGARGPGGVVGSAPIESDLTFALELADAADESTMPRFRAQDLVVETKPDLTPVSEADRATEQALRARIEAERPGDGVVGEEYGETEGSGGRRWILDPIDGTKSFVRGIPAWGTLIGLEQDGEIVVGVVSAPALRRRWWASRGRGAFADGEPIYVSRVAALEDALFCYTSLTAFDEHGMGDQFRSLAVRCWEARGFGDYWAHVLVAEGSADLAVEPIMNLWDNAAVQVIVEEAGGRFTDLDGRPRSDGGNAVTTNGLLHDEVLAVFARRGAG
ncbi:MAG TPA: histidinol-phosphatase [Acidimicrobiia bacterium]|nr:histidinol-phosphatase [Acidimicrobiia bacterium]